MKGVPGGDAAIALIGPAPGKAALAIVIDVTGKLPQAQEMLQKVSAAQAKRGANAARSPSPVAPTRSFSSACPSPRAKGSGSEFLEGHRQIGG